MNFGSLDTAGRQFGPGDHDIHTRQVLASSLSKATDSTTLQRDRNWTRQAWWHAIVVGVLVPCKEVQDPNRGTVIKFDPGYFVVCGYSPKTSRLPSENIIEISSVANTAASEAAEDKIFREFIDAIKDNSEVDSVDCFVGKRFDC